MIQSQVLGQDYGVRARPFKASCHYWDLPMNITPTTLNSRDFMNVCDFL